MAKLTTAELIDAIKELTVLELNDLVKACEEEFGVSAAAGVVVAAAGPAGWRWCRPCCTRRSFRSLCPEASVRTDSKTSFLDSPFNLLLLSRRLFYHVPALL